MSSQHINFNELNARITEWSADDEDLVRKQN